MFNIVNFCSHSSFDFFQPLLYKVISAIRPLDGILERYETRVRGPGIYYSSTESFEDFARQATIPVYPLINLQYPILTEQRQPPLIPIQHHSLLNSLQYSLQFHECRPHFSTDSLHFLRIQLPLYDSRKSSIGMNTHEVVCCMG